jgi:hypothetical protein
MKQEWRCGNCEAIIDEEALLRAPSPFDPDETLRGCPECLCAEDFTPICDKDGCDAEVSCGTPTPTGYRRTCHEHKP